MSAERHGQFVVGKLARQAWRDGFITAWLIVMGLSLALSGFTAESQWLLGAVFGVQIGMTAGYLVTVQRNYRRTKREDLEWQLDRIRDMELRTIARGNPVLGNEGALEHIRDARSQIERALEHLA